MEVMQLAQEANLPLPAGGILISPWVDLNDSFSGTWTSNNDYDFLPRDLAAWFADEYAGKRSLKEVNACVAMSMARGSRLDIQWIGVARPCFRQRIPSDDD